MFSLMETVSLKRRRNSQSTQTLEQTLHRHQIQAHSPISINQSECKLKSSMGSSDQILKAVGLLSVRWVDGSGQWMSLNYGTAFAISPRLIVTCSHNIYSQKKRQLCSQVVYVPGIGTQTVGSARRFKVVNQQHFRYSKPVDSFGMLPSREEIAMILLEEQLEEGYFMEISELEASPIWAQLQLVGYPSSSYRGVLDLDQLKPQRAQLKGMVHQLDNFILHHTMKTQVGESGSPILASHQGKLYALGIHTHRGTKNGFNSGVYFDGGNLQTLRRYRRELQQLASLKRWEFKEERPQVETEFNQFYREMRQAMEDDMFVVGWNQMSQRQCVAEVMDPSEMNYRDKWQIADQWDKSFTKQ